MLGDGDARICSCTCVLLMLITFALMTWVGISVACGVGLRRCVGSAEVLLAVGVLGIDCGRVVLTGLLSACPGSVCWVVLSGGCEVWCAAGGNNLKCSGGARGAVGKGELFVGAGTKGGDNAL